MSERAAFISAILDHPDEDTPRLMLADWLDEHGAAIKCLASAPRFAALKSLGLRFNMLGNDAIEVLLASQTLPGALALDVSRNGFSQRRFARALAKRFTGGSD